MKTILASAFATAALTALASPAAALTVTTIEYRGTATIDVSNITNGCDFDPDACGPPDPDFLVGQQVPFLLTISAPGPVSIVGDVPLFDFAAAYEEGPTVVANTAYLASDNFLFDTSLILRDGRPLTGRIDFDFSGDGECFNVGRVTFSGLFFSFESRGCDYRFRDDEFFPGGGFDLAYFYDIRGSGRITDIRFDGVSVPAVIPEPATWAMMIAGFGLVGGALRRRRGALAA